MKQHHSCFRHENRTYCSRDALTKKDSAWTPPRRRRPDSSFAPSTKTWD